jgi:hypothetical protein
LAKFFVIFSQNGDMRKEYYGTEAGYVIGITLDRAADIVLLGGIRARGSTSMRAYDARNDAQTPGFHADIPARGGHRPGADRRQHYLIVWHRRPPNKKRHLAPFTNKPAA